MMEIAKAPRKLNPLRAHTYQERTNNSTCHRQPYTASESARRLARSVLWANRFYCEKCRVWHLTKS